MTSNDGVIALQRLKELPPTNLKGGRCQRTTRLFPGNIFVLRALRAIPLVREVRIASRDMVAERMADAMVAAGHTASRERLLEAAYLTTELTCSGMEMILEESSRDGRQICIALAGMMVTYYSQLDA